jgi:uncharacterized membrane protein YedE/YeeE
MNMSDTVESHRVGSPSVSSPERDIGPSEAPSLAGLLLYLVLGALFGVVLTKSEVISWFRIQEMFRFQAFHMYGIIGSAIVTAALGLQVIRRLGLRTLDGSAIEVPPKAMGRGTRYWLGGAIFGLGWALVGACPGPLFALLGTGVGVIAVPLVAALAGTWVYGALRSRLPH